MLQPAGVLVGERLRAQRLATALLEVVLATLEHLAGRDVERERGVMTGAEARGLNGFDDDLERVFVALEIRREAAFVTHTRGELARHEHLLERVEHLRAHTQSVAERLSAHGHDHELLEVDGVGRVRATVQDVHHRHRQRARHRATQIAIQRQADFERRGTRHGHRHAQQRIGAEASLVLGAVEIHQRAVDRDLIGRVHILERFVDLGVHVIHGREHALATVALRIAVTQFDRFAFARAGAARDGGTTRAARFEDDVHFYSGIAAAVENLARANGNDSSHKEKRSKEEEVRRTDVRYAEACSASTGAARREGSIAGSTP